MRRAPRGHGLAAATGRAEAMDGGGARWQQHQCAEDRYRRSGILAAMRTAPQCCAQPREADQQRGGGHDRVRHGRCARFRAFGRFVRRIRTRRSDEDGGASLCQEGAGHDERCELKPWPAACRLHVDPSGIAIHRSRPITTFAGHPVPSSARPARGTRTNVCRGRDAPLDRCQSRPLLFPRAGTAVRVSDIEWDERNRVHFSASDPHGLRRQNFANLSFGPGSRRSCRRWASP